MVRVLADLGASSQFMNCRASVDGALVSIQTRRHDHSFASSVSMASRSLSRNCATVSPAQTTASATENHAWGATSQTRAVLSCDAVTKANRFLKAFNSDKTIFFGRVW